MADNDTNTTSMPSTKDEIGETRAQHGGLANTVLVGIGAVAIDTILIVPCFPAEDSKLRATKLTKRRGGNIGNTFEVFNQLVEDIPDAKHKQVLLAPLPARTSDATLFIQRSFLSDPTGPLDNLRLNMTYCMYRTGVQEPISSYIISSQQAGTRTIINHNQIEEMSLTEFNDALNKIDVRYSAVQRRWFHLEGRIPDVALDCIKRLRESQPREDQSSNKRLRLVTKEKAVISVEVEKPGREGLQDLAYLADVVFYSKSWAIGEGYRSAEECVKAQARKSFKARSPVALAQGQTMICTWGEDGAYAVRFAAFDDKEDVIFKEEAHSPAYKVGKPVVDTVGAGDTFIAAMLFGLLKRTRYELADQILSPDAVKKSLRFASCVAGLKVVQDGFSDLGQQIREAERTGILDTSQSTKSDGLI